MSKSTESIRKHPNSVGQPLLFTASVSFSVSGQQPNNRIHSEASTHRSQRKSSIGGGARPWIEKNGAQTTGFLGVLISRPTWTRTWSTHFFQDLGHTKNSFGNDLWWISIAMLYMFVIVYCLLEVKFNPMVSLIIGRYAYTTQENDANIKVETGKSTGQR